MKTIKNSDINFKIDTTLIDVENFSIKFYTVNSSNFFIRKTQDNIEEVEREATVEDEEVIKSGGTTVTEYFLKLDWSELETIGQGVMNYRCINNKVDSGFKDKWYNRLVEKSTDYYIDSDTVITADEDKAYGERLNELVANLDVEKSERIDADAQLDEKIGNVESSLTESINGEITRATEAENGLDTKITDISSKLDGEIKRSTDTDNALRQDLTDESELRSSADTAIWQAINAEVTRSTNAETEIDAKVDNYIVANNKAVTDEIARATIEETRISNKLDSYITSNDTALNGEIERAKAKETEIESKVNSNNGAVADETSRAQARENEIDKKITDYVTSNNKALADEVLRATTQENAISSKLDNYITSNDKVVNGLDNAITKETERATTQESAISSKLDGYITSNDKAIADLNASIKGSFSGSYNDLTDVPTEFTPASHTHSSSDIENLTGYAKGDDVSTIKATDSLNEALSKLENQIGSKLASDNFNSYTSKTDSSISAISETATNANSKADDNAKSHAALSGKVDTYIESNNNALNNEITRATTQENALSSRIDGLASSSALESEIERAKAMETVLSGAIDTKVSIADYNAYTAITRNDIDSKLDATAYTPTDLSNYYTKDETYSKSEIDSKGYLTEHQDISGTLDVSAYTPTDLSNYYTKDETYSKKQVDDAIKGVDVSSQLTNYATMQWVEDKNYLTQHQDISGKADKADVYTKAEIDSKGYLTEHQDISGKLDVTAYTPTDLSNYYTKEQTYSKEQVDDAIKGVDLTEYVKKVDNEIPTNEVWQESKGNWRGGDTDASKVIITLPESVAATDSRFQIVVSEKRLKDDYIGGSKVMMYNPVSGKIDYYDNYSEFATVTINDDKSLTIDPKDGYKINSAYATQTNEPVTIKAFIETIVGGQSAQFIQSYIVPKIASVEDAAKQGFNSMFFEKGAKSVTLHMERNNTETMIASIDFDNTIRFKNDKLAANILVPLKESGYTQINEDTKCCSLDFNETKKIRVVIDPTKMSETDYDARWFSVYVRNYDLDFPNLYDESSNNVSYGADKKWRNSDNSNLITVENIDENTVDVSINEPTDGRKRYIAKINNNCRFGTCNGGGMDVYTYDILKQDIVDYAQALDTRITTLETNGGGSTTGGSVDLSNYYTKAETYSKSEIDSKGYLTEHQDISGKLDVTAYTPTDLTDYYTKEETYSKGEIDSKGYLTAHQDISGKADKVDVYTKEEIDSKGYLTAHQDISGKADKADVYTKAETYST